MISHSFHPEADAELEDASLFYESRMAGLGKSFAAEVERTISLIRQFPDAGSPIGIARRRVLIARFPYSVVYRRDPDAIVILEVASSPGQLPIEGKTGHFWELAVPLA